MTQDILDSMKDNRKIELRGFNKIDRCVLNECSRKKKKLYIKANQNWKYYWYKYLDKRSQKKDWPLSFWEEKEKNQNPDGKEGLKNW